MSWFEDEYCDEADDEDRGIFCDRCNTGGLQWSDKWSATRRRYIPVLVDENGETHKCPVDVTDVFPDLS